MQILTLSQLSAADPHALFAFFISKDNLQASKELCKKQLGEASTLEEVKAGSNQLGVLAGRIALYVGVDPDADSEAIRQAAHAAYEIAEQFQFSELVIIPMDDRLRVSEAIAESLVLSSYQFMIYKSTPSPRFVKQAFVLADSELAASALEHGAHIAQATCLARDLVNEPVITLTAPEFSRRIVAFGEQYGFDTEIWEEEKIKSMKMGGLLAVNAGSEIPPTFNILNYKPENPINKKPIILVGKGVVFDTGGLSLKPTTKSMDFMKSDMAGAASVVGAICGLALLKANYHVIGLIPATDNRPGKNAVVPGDVIRMHDGTSVEVLNTDAEGRLILGDALAYAKTYDPEIVIDLATLTGAAVTAVGSPAIAMMGTAREGQKAALKQSGEAVYERLVEFPLWKEYGDMLKSEIADLKNLGGSEAGAITAGKFLAHFTDYPWIHLDIAGASWLFSKSSYRGKQASGVGVRLLINFISNYEQE